MLQMSVTMIGYYATECQQHHGNPLDIWVWYRIADKIKKENSNSSANVLGYFPFYCLYYILMMFHVQFAQAALGIGNRFRHLNVALYEMFPECTTLTHADSSSFDRTHHPLAIFSVGRTPRIEISSINLDSDKNDPIDVDLRKCVANVAHGRVLLNSTSKWPSIRSSSTFTNHFQDLIGSEPYHREK
uniref:Uncharacterized protein n=1 Tax=Anopheles melas TaxID=34690 RepID=A0A182UK77_9DIPT